MKKIIINTSLALLSIILLLGLLEFGLRIYRRQRNKDIVYQNALKLTAEHNISRETFNIYYFGGSTMYGGPYAPQVSIPKLVQYMLADKIAGKKICSVMNTASGFDFRWNLAYLKEIVENKEVFQPSLCVIYAGHNEYLTYHGLWGFINRLNFMVIGWLREHSLLAEKLINIFKLRSFRLEIDERKYFDQPLFGNKGYRDVTRRYAYELKEVANLLRKNKIPLIISTVAANYSDWEPNRSVFYGSRSNRLKFKQAMDKGMKAEKMKSFVQAIEFYQHALMLCGTFAETHYRLGRCYQAIGKYEEANKAYQKAVEYDRMPIRALPAQNSFIRELATEKNVYLVDAVEYLYKHADNRLIGFNLMVDAHHPNLKGYILISQLIAKKVKDIFSPEDKQLNRLNQTQAETLFKIDSSKEFEIYFLTGRWFYRLATWRYDPTERLRLSEESFLKAMAINQSRYEPYLGIAMVNFLRKNAPLAEKYLSRAKQIEPREVEEYLRQPWVRFVIRRAKSSSCKGCD